MDNLCVFCDELITEGHLNACLHVLCGKCLNEFKRFEEKRTCNCGEEFDLKTMVQWSKQPVKEGGYPFATGCIPDMLKFLDSQLDGQTNDTLSFHVKEMEAKTNLVKETYHSYKNILHEYYAGKLQEMPRYLFEKLNQECKEYDLQGEFLKKLFDDARTMKDYLLVLQNEEFFQQDTFEMVNMRYHAFMDTVRNFNILLGPVRDLLQKEMYAMCDGHICNAKILKLQAIKNEFTFVEPVPGKDCPYQTIRGQMKYSNEIACPILRCWYPPNNQAPVIETSYSRTEYLFSLEGNVIVLEHFDNGYEHVLISSMDVKVPTIMHSLFTDRESSISTEVLPVRDKTTGHYKYLQLFQGLEHKKFVAPSDYLYDQDGNAHIDSEPEFTPASVSENVLVDYQGKKDADLKKYDGECEGTHTLPSWQLICTHREQSNLYYFHRNDWMIKGGCPCVFPYNPHSFPQISGLTQFNNEQVITFAVTKRMLFFIDISNGELKRELPLHGIKEDPDIATIRLSFLPKEEIVVLLFSSTLYFINLDGYAVRIINLEDEMWFEDTYMIVIDDKDLVVKHENDIYSLSLV